MVRGGSPVFGAYTVAPFSRHSILVDAFPYLGFAEVSVRLDSDQPIVAERSMYFNYKNRDGGHASVGVPSMSKEWYFAEGYTGY